MRVRLTVGVVCVATLGLSINGQQSTHLNPMVDVLMAKKAIFGLGVPTVVIGVPARHIHSHGSIIHRDDYDHAVQLVTAVVAKLDAATVAGLTND